MDIVLVICLLGKDLILRFPIQRKETQSSQRFSQGQHANRELSVVNWKYKGMDMNTKRMVK